MELWRYTEISKAMGLTFQGLSIERVQIHSWQREKEVGKIHQILNAIGNPFIVYSDIFFI
jgi:hypothetical protein